MRRYILSIRIRRVAAQLPHSKFASRRILHRSEYACCCNPSKWQQAAGQTPQWPSPGASGQCFKQPIPISVCNLLPSGCAVHGRGTATSGITRQLAAKTDCRVRCASTARQSGPCNRWVDFPQAEAHERVRRSRGSTALGYRASATACPAFDRRPCAAGARRPARLLDAGALPHKLPTGG